MKKAEEMKGFTIIELMVVLVVAAILLGVGVPSFVGMTKKNRLESAAREMAAAIDLARSEASGRGTWVSLCKSNVAGGEPYSCASSGDWSQGWIMFTDNGAYPDADNGDFDTGETLIRIHRGPEEGVSITCSAGGNDSNGDFLGVDTFMTLSRFGRRLVHERIKWDYGSNTGASRRQYGKLQVCLDREGETGWEIELKESGQMTKKKIICS